LPQTIILCGTVFSGSCQGKRFVDLPWVKKQIISKLGFTPYSGTLNLYLNSENAKKRIQIEHQKGIEVNPEIGYLPGTLYKATINNQPCAIVIPKVPDYPKNVIEIIAPTYLRGQHKLEDGKEVTVVVTV
jgi:CTP-dependent riboflavin kinase